jgi:hypothetical protein
LLAVAQVALGRALAVVAVAVLVAIVHLFLVSQAVAEQAQKLR